MILSPILGLIWLPQQLEESGPILHKKKYSSSVSYQHEDFTAPHRVGRSPIPNLKKIKHVWHLRFHIRLPRTEVLQYPVRKCRLGGKQMLPSTVPITSSQPGFRVLLSPLLVYGAKHNANQDSQHNGTDHPPYICLSTPVTFQNGRCVVSCSGQTVLWVTWQDYIIRLKMSSCLWSPHVFEIGPVAHSLHNSQISYFQNIVVKFYNLNLIIFLCLYINSTFFLVPFFLATCFLIFHVYRLFLILRGFETMLHVHLEL